LKANTAKVGEVVVILDIVATIYQKERNIIYGKIIITTDNRNLFQIMQRMKAANEHIQDRLAEVIQINEILTEG